MKSYLALLLTVFLAICSSASANEAYYYGDGQPAFILQPPSDLARAIDSQAGPVLQAGEQEIALTERLGRGGDVLFLDANGVLVLRQSLTRSAIYYKTPDDTGQPVITRRAALPENVSAAAPMKDWIDAYAYQGHVRKEDAETRADISARSASETAIKSEPTH